MRSKLNSAALVCMLLLMGATQTFAQFTASAGNNATICAGGSDTIIATGTGGTTPYNFSWSNAATTQSIIVSPSSTTTYTVTVTDGIAETATASVTVAVAANPVINVSATPNTTCVGSPIQLTGSLLPPSCGVGMSTTGSAQAQIGSGAIIQPGTGFTSPGIFGNLNNSSRQQMLYTAAELQAALGGPQVISQIAFNVATFNSNDYLYNFSISMACTGVDSLTSWQGSLQQVLSPGSFQPTAGFNNFVLTNGFYWDGVSNLVVDICFYDPATFGNQNNKAQCTNTTFSSYLYAASNAGDICGVNAAVTTSTIRPNIKFTYGAPVATSYTYAWSPTSGPGAVSNASIANPTAVPTQATTYNLIVTGPMGCQATDSVTVTINSNPIANAGVNQTIETCSPNGITIGGTPTASAGSGPYTYGWTPVVGISSATVPNPVVQGLGTNVEYTVTVTDHNGCTASSSVNITADTTGFRIDSIHTTNVSCNGGSNGSLCVYAPGAVLPYMWSNGATSQCITNLLAASYWVTVTNSTGCTASASIAITQPPVLIANITGTTGTCGTNNGTLTVEPTGGTPGYTYVWNPFATTSSLTDLGAGTYTVTVTDQNGCTTTASTTISQSPAITIDSIQLHPSTCYNLGNGNICVYPSGSGPFTYEWSDFQTDQCNFYLSAGRFYVTITDSHGCTAVVDTAMNQPAAIQNTFNSTGTTCTSNTGTIIANVTGGTPAYTYRWSNSGTTNQLTGLSAGTYVLTVIDGNGCSVVFADTLDPAQAAFIDSIPVTNISCNGDANGRLCVYASGSGPFTYTWSNLATSQCITNLVTGDYIVTVTNSNSCTATASATVSQPTQIQDFFTVTNVTCPSDSSGMVSLIVTGGTGNYVYGWNSDQTTAEITHVPAGTYSVTITDAAGCTLIDSAVVTQPQDLYTSGVIQNAGCSGGQTGGVILTGYGGTFPYTFSWSNGATTQNISGVSSGNYFVTMTDAHGCQVASLYIVNGNALTIDSAHLINDSCYGYADGSICVYASGSGSLSYLWSNSATTQCISNLQPGNYFITVTNSANCTASASATITQPAPLTDSIGIAGCQAYSIVTGGTPPYNYFWSNGATGALIDVWANNIYYETVTDVNNCSISNNLSTQSNYPFHLQLLEPDSNAVPDSVILIVHGGTPPFDVQWTNSGTLDTLADSTGAHVYNSGQNSWITVVDSNGCGAQYRVDVGCTDQCVWPGDANYDGIVNNLDLLAIGVAYDSIGYARTSPTINFIPQYCVPWNDTLLGGVNYKHVDCNGDGIINALDTNAIMLNYSLTHPRSGGASNWKNNAPALTISISPDTLVDGQIATATLSLGDSAMPCINVYALAFTYNFDPLVVDTGTAAISFGNSWLAGTGDHINISKNFYTDGQIQSAITRIDHINRSGYGPIATVSMKITTGNINGLNLSYYVMNNFITNLTVIDSAGNIQTVNAGFDSAQIAFTPTHVTPLCCSAGIAIYPNPANNLLHITTNGINGIQQISIADLTGQQVLQQNTTAGSNFDLDITSLSAGIYLIDITTATQNYHNRFVKVNVK